MKHFLRLATRKSPLALEQANQIKLLLEEQDHNLVVEVIGFTTSGDQSATDPSRRLSGKGDFLKELEIALSNGSADLAIHSMKDVPAEVPEGLEIRAVGPRADARDALVGAKSLHQLGSDATIGTSSTRRQALLRHVANTRNVKPIRGNIDTRLAKLANREFQALILAAAGLKRLGLGHLIDDYLDPTIFVPAAGQGWLAAEYRTDDKDVHCLVESLQTSGATNTSECERNVVRALDADCTAPIGVYCTMQGNEYFLHAVVLDPAGEHAIRVSLCEQDPEKLASKASRQLLAMGAHDLFEAARCESG